LYSAIANDTASCDKSLYILVALLMTL